MKIIRLQSENIKKLKAIDITPKTELVKISGKNGQGKTSVLDSILYALAGKKAIPSKPIRDGEEKGKITLDLGDFVVERSFTTNNTYLKVTTKDGAEYPKAQEKLSELVKGISFDPYEFANMDNKKQTETLVQLLGIQSDLDAIDTQYRELYEERTIANRQYKDSKAVFDGMEKPADCPQEKVDVSDISDRLEQEREKFRTIQACNSDIEEVKSEISTLEESLSKCKEELKRLENLKKETEKDYSEEKGKELKELLENASTINATIDKAKEYEAKEAEMLKYKERAENIEKDIKTNRDSREQLVKTSKMPITDLNITDDGVVYNGIPFNQLATSEKLKVSLAISMAMNPELKVIRILDGSLLDSDNLEVISQMAKDNDYQVWVEIVDNSGEVGFYIEDGEVKNAN